MATISKEKQRKKAESVKKKYELTWISIEGVVLINTEEDDNKKPCIFIGVDGDIEAVKNKIGEEQDGVKIVFGKSKPVFAT